MVGRKSFVCNNDDQVSHRLGTWWVEDLVSWEDSVEGMVRWGGGGGGGDKKL